MANPTAKGHWKYIYKSAITGQIVTEAYAQANPSTTVREKVWVPE
jgi:hypothetical protein